MMTDQITFGVWLKQRRKALDLTQVELAERVGCAVITLQKFEAGDRRPSRQMARRLAGQLNLAAEDGPSFIDFARSGAARRSLDPNLEVVAHPGWMRLPNHLANLPSQLTPLVGRGQEVAGICRRLLGVDARLLTLVGPPGVGKTRLAIDAAARLLNQFEDGLVFVPLASIRDPDLAALSLAQAIGVDQIGQRCFTGRLKAYLQDKHLLLVLDNFEQILSAAGLVAELLSACPWLSVLVTSRAPLGIPGERQFPVLPLAVPGEDCQDNQLEALLCYPSVELFLKRAQDVRPDFELTEENAGEIAALCVRLDGLPLAIELAAARTGCQNPQELLALLHQSNLLHVDGLRGVPDRHRSLYHAIDWSYTLLNPLEQSLFMRLSVFRAGFTLEAVQRMMPELPGNIAADALAALLRNYLVMHILYNGQKRYLMLETIRAYALERLVESGEELNIRQRHAEVYLALVQEAEPNLRTNTQVAWLDRLEAERENLHAGMHWFLEHAGDFEKGQQFVISLGWFWNMRCHVSEGREWLAKALNAPVSSRPEYELKLLCMAGALAWQQGELAEARSDYERCIALCRGLSPQPVWHLALALAGLANVVMYQTDQLTVERAAQESLALFEQIQDTWGCGLALCLLAEAQLLRHDYCMAHYYFGEGLRALRTTGDRWATGVALMDIGYTNTLMGNLDEARAQLEESIALHRVIGEKSVRSLSLNVLAEVMRQQGDLLAAAEFQKEGLDLLRKMGIADSIADVQYNLAAFVQAHGNYQLAERLYTGCLDLFSVHKNEAGYARCKLKLSEMRS